MLMRRFSKHIQQQDWTAFAIDFLIVVVGVFIGIQAANWNEERTLDRQEQVHLEQLLVDLEVDRQIASRGIQSADDIDAAADLLLSIIEDADYSSTASDADLMAAVPEAGYAYIPRPQTTTYDEMISTGALSRIEDIELKRALTRYYERLEAGQQWNVLLRDEQFAYRAAIRGLLSRDQFAWARENYSDPANAQSEMPPFNRTAFIAALRSRPEIANSLRSMGAVQQRLRDSSQSMDINASALAQEIVTALER